MHIVALSMIILSAIVDLNLENNNGNKNTVL